MALNKKPRVQKLKAFIGYGSLRAAHKSWISIDLAASHIPVVTADAVGQVHAVHTVGQVDGVDAAAETGDVGQAARRRSHGQAGRVQGRYVD